MSENTEPVRFSVPAPPAPPVPSVPAYLSSAVESPPRPDWVTRQDALLYGQACRQHTKAWNASIVGVFLLGVILGPVSIIRGLVARSQSKRSGVKTLGLGPVVFGVFVTLWGVFVLYWSVHFFTSVLPSWENALRQQVDSSVNGSVGGAGQSEDVLGVLEGLLTGKSGVASAGNIPVEAIQAGALMRVNEAAGNSVVFNGNTLSSVNGDGSTAAGGVVPLPARSQVVVNGSAVTGIPAPVASGIEWCVSVPSADNSYIIVDNTNLAPQTFTTPCLE